MARWRHVEGCLQQDSPFDEVLCIARAPQVAIAAKRVCPRSSRVFDHRRGCPLVAVRDKLLRVVVESREMVVGATRAARARRSAASSHRTGDKRRVCSLGATTCARTKCAQFGPGCTLTPRAHLRGFDIDCRNFSTSAVATRTAPRCSTGHDRYIVRAISSIAPRFLRNASRRPVRSIPSAAK
jgi:hypothetical protein